MKTLRSGPLSIAITAALACIAVAVLPGCQDAPPDPRFATPQATVDSLFASYGVSDVPEAEIRQRMRSRGRFDLLDGDLYQSCFADFHGEADEGLAGYVFGNLVAGKDQLRITLSSDSATIFPTSAEGSPRPVMLRREDGEWKIVLRESVPTEIQERLATVYQRSKEMERRRGAPR